jgi:uncharacterized DUF497 family protein
MEFDWNNPPFEWSSSLTPRDVEESFEDPFAIRLLPDSTRYAAQARYFNLGKSAGGAGIFSVYRTNGKQIRVIYVRPFEAEEGFFYQKKLNQALSQQS